MSTSTLLVSRILLAISTLALLHAAFSAYENLSLLKAMGTPSRQPPRDAVIEAVLALFIFIVGAILNAPGFKPNTWASEMAHRSIDEMDSRMGFAAFNHRGKDLFGKRTQ